MSNKALTNKAFRVKMASLLQKLTGTITPNENTIDDEESLNTDVFNEVLDNFTNTMQRQVPIPSPSKAGQYLVSTSNGSFNLQDVDVIRLVGVKETINGNDYIKINNYTVRQLMNMPLSGKVIKILYTVPASSSPTNTNFINCIYDVVAVSQGLFGITIWMLYFDIKNSNIPMQILSGTGSESVIDTYIGFKLPTTE